MKGFTSHLEEDINGKRQIIVPINNNRSKQSCSECMEILFEGERHGNKLWNAWCRQASRNTPPFLCGCMYKKWRYLQSHNINKHKTCSFEEIFIENLRIKQIGTKLSTWTHLPVQASQIVFQRMLDYFCRRANEDMESMTKETFVIGTLRNEKGGQID